MADDMNEGVRLLLARMESHPEEFEKYGRWHEILSLATSDNFLSADEIAQINTKLIEQRRRWFTSAVMTRLMADESGPDKVNMQPKSGVVSTAQPVYMQTAKSSSGLMANVFKFKF